MIVEVLKRVGVFMGDHGVRLADNNEWTPYLRASMMIAEEMNPELGWKGLEWPSPEEIEGYWRRIPDYQQEGSWGIKLPVVCVLLPAYLRRFPDARLIYLERNREDVLESLLRRDGRDREHWEEFIDVYDGRFRQVAEDYHTIRYEKFCENPVEETEKLCEYLGIEFPEGIKGWLNDYIKTDRIDK